MTSTLPSKTPSNLQTILQNIQAAKEDAGRLDQNITLVAVSKTKPANEIMPVLEEGHRIFGENKIQETAEKWPDLRVKYPDVELHLIGPLQSNKVRQAIQLFDVIESIDRPKLARAIARISKQENKYCDGYIQINIGKETQKAGIDPDEADDFIAFCRVELKLSIVGLMCIPPADQDPIPYFLRLKKIAQRNGLDKLSMGMSSDYHAAIECGATSVRVGTAIFGARP